LCKLPYNIKFYKWKPLNLNAYFYIVLVIKGIHLHSLPPLYLIPKSIKDQLQKIIILNQNLEDVTPWKLISGKL